MCFPACAFFRVAQDRVIERCAGYGANTARLAAFMLYPRANQCGNYVARRSPRSFPSFESRCQAVRRDADFLDAGP
jgi:hypothetical protein